MLPSCFNLSFPMRMPAPINEFIHHLPDLFPGFPETDHDAGFGEHGWIQFFHLFKQGERREIAGAGADRDVCGVSAPAGFLPDPRTMLR